MIDSLSGAPTAGDRTRGHGDRLGVLLARAAEALRTTDLTLLGSRPDRPVRTPNHT